MSKLINFWKNKAKEAHGMRMQEITCVCSHGACEHRHDPVHACRVSKTMKGKFVYNQC